LLWVGSAMGLWLGMLIGEDELAAILASLSLIVEQVDFCVFVLADRRCCDQNPE
jgi:hypothetical protein